VVRIPGAEPLPGTPNDIAEALRAFAQEGIDEVQVWLAPNSPAEVEAFAPVLEQLDRA
jgi:alkanesulfonate monooxygenase SsuD/methylene tetrahydromethanopterin reductase-like flavin-dependent oxidoreductase (luciferase family)